jgi:hypothetical protein
LGSGTANRSSTQPSGLSSPEATRLELSLRGTRAEDTSRKTQREKSPTHGSLHYATPREKRFKTDIVIIFQQPGSKQCLHCSFRVGFQDCYLCIENDSSKLNKAVKVA